MRAMLAPRLSWCRNWMRPALFSWGLVALVACTDKRTGGEERRARPGIVQVGSADGPLLDEDEACERLSQILSDAADTLGCDAEEVEIAACPELIRPGGSVACRRFSEESLDECEQSVGDYASCGDFISERCILVAVLDEFSEDCQMPGPADSGADEPPSEVTDDAGEGEVTTDATPSETADAAVAMEAGTPADGAVDASTVPSADAATSMPEAGAEPVPDAGAVDAAAPSTGDAAALDGAVAP